MADQVSLAWDPSPGPDLGGYTVYYGDASGVYTNSIDVGNTLLVTVSNLVKRATYYFVVKAYDIWGLESEPSNEVSYTVPDGTSGTGTVLLAATRSGTLRNNFSGLVGTKIVIGNKPIKVTALGRFTAANNANTHTVKLVNAGTGADVQGGAVTVTMKPAAAGTFEYTALPTPVTLNADTAYYIVSSEQSGKDYWWDQNAILEPTDSAVATVACAVWSTGNGVWNLSDTANRGYVPPNLKYESGTTTTNDAPPPPPPPPPIPVSGGYLTQIAPGTLEDEYSGFAGMEFKVGAEPVIIGALGRFKVPGNSGTHVVKLVDASTGSDVPGASVQISMTSGVDGKFHYGNLAVPVVLPASARYFLVSEETVGGDLFYDDSTMVLAGAQMTVLGAVSGYGAGTWYRSGEAGQTFGPVDVVFTNAPPPVTSELQLGTSYILGTLRNNFSGWVGMTIQVGSAPLKVASLGRLTATGNRASHVVKLVRGSDGVDVPGGSVTIDMSKGTVGQFAYARLASPLTLEAGKAYHLVSQETNGGDAWFNNDTQVTTAGIAQLTPVYSYGTGSWDTSTKLGRTYGPVNLTYEDPAFQSPTEEPYVTKVTQGRTRNDFTGFVGMRFTVGAAPVKVTALGRLALTGNSRTHKVKLVQASNGSDVAGATVSVSMGKTNPGHFAYTRLAAPVTLKANTAYFLLSEELSGGDTWCDMNTRLTCTSVAGSRTPIWGYGPGEYYAGGSEGETYGPSSFLYLVE